MFSVGDKVMLNPCDRDYVRYKALFFQNKPAVLVVERISGKNGRFLSFEFDKEDEGHLADRFIAAPDSFTDEEIAHAIIGCSPFRMSMQTALKILDVVRTMDKGSKT